MSARESTAQIPSKQTDAEGRSERAYKAAAHNQGNYPEGRLHAAEKFAELHEKRTGEKIDPREEAGLAEAVYLEPKKEEQLIHEREERDPQLKEIVEEP